MALSFKGRHFEKSIILTSIRWYLAYKLSTRDLEEMMAERGVHVDHSTIHWWVLRYTPELEGELRKRKKPVSGADGFGRNFLRPFYSSLGGTFGITENLAI